MAVACRCLALFLIPLTLLLVACDGATSESPFATPSVEATRLAPLVVTRSPNTPTPTPAPTITPVPSPTPTATPPTLAANESIVIGGELRTRKEPSTTSEIAGTLADKAKVQIAARVQGENWLVGTQKWAMTVPPWASEWFRLSDGSYVYGAFVFILQPGETSPTAPVPNGVEKWVDVDISKQTARAMVGDKAVFTAPISTGAPPFDTPKGKKAVEPDGRIAVEKMTATQAGYDAAQAQYDVERVLFTQYFDQKGNALHLNYWRPHSVFGKQATSHGCVGMELHEAQYFWLFAQAGTPVEIHK
jgi:lipoprotein-anchoring transpeptidase ErfK/SrfK